MTSFDARTADKLAKVLALLGSPYDGERAGAALLADRLMREAGLTWRDLLSRAAVLAGAAQPAPLSQPPADPWTRARWTLARLRRAKLHEREFLADIAGRAGPLSWRQEAWLDALVQRAQAESVA